MTITNVILCLSSWQSSPASLLPPSPLGKTSSSTLLFSSLPPRVPPSRVKPPPPPPLILSKGVWWVGGKKGVVKQMGAPYPYVFYLYSHFL